MGCNSSRGNSPDDNRQMSPVVHNNNNDRQGDNGDGNDGGHNDGDGNDRGDNDGDGNDRGYSETECDSDFLFFYEMESDSDEVG